MPTTFSDITPVRRVAVGDCSGPLGSGFDALARSAYASLLRSGWTESADPPFLPVHDNGQTANKTIPRGDAWKCSYGYDAAARTERSACGAVCYTFALPADAYSGTPANISTVSLSLTGDRYLDAGVDLYIIPSASPTPPKIVDNGQGRAVIDSATPVGTYCETSDQSPKPPNERHGVTEAVEATPGVTAQPYLHVALLLHDYTTNRDAWIEGGAMLEGATATITFSREVQITLPNVRILRVTRQYEPGVLSEDAGLRTHLYFKYTYVEAPNSLPPYSDLELLFRLAQSGQIKDVDSLSLWEQYDASQTWISQTSFSISDGHGGSRIDESVSGAVYHTSPGIAPGMIIPVSFSSRGAMTVALVQSSIPISDSSSSIPISENPASGVLDGTMRDVVAIERGVTPTDGVANVNLTVNFAPTKPLLVLVIVPEGVGNVATFDQTPVLVASMPTA